MADQLKSRSEMKLEETWNLGDMYPDMNAFQADLALLKEDGAVLAGMKGQVCASAEQLLAALKQEEKLSMTAEKLLMFASCQYDQDTADQENLALSSKTEAAAAEIDAETSFLAPELLTCPEEQLEQYFAQLPELEHFRNHVKEILRMKPYTLSAEMERLVALNAELSAVPGQTCSVLSYADLPGSFPEVTGEDGEPVQLTHGRFVPLLSGRNREVRKEVFEAYYGVYRKFLNTFAALFNGQVKAQIFNAKARGFRNTLEAAVIENDVSPKIYYTLIDTVSENLDALHRYVALRKRALKLDELHMYDVYTPIIPDFTKKVTYEEAKETALKALAPLGEDYLEVIREGFENRWIDVYENKGKRSGAYENAAYGCHPYVLLNFAGELDDMFTLVHEMGHAMHSYYSNRTQTFADSHYKIFVAEVASTVNEVLLLEYLLAHTDDRAERCYLLNQYLDMFKGTLFRQTQFAEFEMVANRIAEEEGGLSADVLSREYLRINRKYYGPDMVSDDDIAIEWARIPHFYYNFYVYQYSTCFCTAVAVAQTLLHDGAPALQRYRTFLSSGCTKAPAALLKELGVDLETGEPIRAAIDVMRRVLDELEAIL